MLQFQVNELDESMRQLTLREYQTEPAVPLASDERDALRRSVRDVQVTPAFGIADRYDLTPGSYVGAITLLDRLAVEIRPKLPIDRVVFMLSYALDPKAFGPSFFSFADARTLVDAMVVAFEAHLRRAFAKGLLQGYQTHEDALSTVRGQIRFADQVRRHFGLTPPIEVRFDEFTEDIVENRLLKAALRRLRRLTIRSARLGNVLVEFERALERVSDVEFDPRALPRIAYTRLNSNYRGAVEFSKLILRSVSFEVGHGGVIASTLLVDMNDVFENFVVAALRDALGVTSNSFPQGGRTGFVLDTGRRIGLQPDMSWWEGPTCRFVGDIKYKRTHSTPDGAIGPNADLYQLLAYVIAANLESGLLVYAAGERDPGMYRIRFANRFLEVYSLDVTGEPAQLLGEIKRLASRVLWHRAVPAGRDVAVA